MSGGAMLTAEAVGPAVIWTVSSGTLNETEGATPSAWAGRAGEAPLRVGEMDVFGML